MATMLDAVINLKDNFSSTLKQVEKSVGDFSRTSKRMGRGIQRTGKSVSAVGGTLTKSLTVPLIGAGAAAIKVGMDFEESMSNVKAVTGATSSEMELLEKAARDAGAKTSKSAKEAADALGYMGLAGWDVKDSMEGLMPILRLSEAGNIDLGRASDLVTDSMSAMGVEVKDLEKYLDIVAQTSRNSNTDIDAMMEAYLDVGGVLRGLNVPLEESAVSLGMLANAGIKGGESGKKLSSILTNLTSPVGRAKKALDELGFSAFDNEGNFKGLDNVLFELKDKMKGMTTEQQNNYKSMIAGKENIDGLNALLNGLDDSYEELTGSVKDSKGALDEVAKTMLDNLKGALVKIASAFQEIGLKIYDILKPALKDGADLVQKLTDKLNNLTPEQTEMISKFVKFAIVIGPALRIIGKMTTGIGRLVTEFGFFAGRVKGLGLMGAIFTPGVKIVLILGAIVLAAIAVYKNWDKLKEIFIKVKDTILDFAGITSEKIEWIKEVFKSLASTIWEKIQEVIQRFEPLKEAFGQLFSKLGELFNLVMPFLMPILAFIGGIFVGGLIVHFQTLFLKVMAVIEGIAGFIEGLVMVFQGFIDFFIGVFTGDWSRAWEGIKTIFDGVVQIITSIWETFVGFITAPVEAVLDLLDGMFHEKMEGVRKAWEDLKEFFKHPIKGTVGLIKKGAGWVGDKLGIGNNYKGTNSWTGGPTWVHERGAEIIDLPNRTRIYPHDKSLAMAKEKGRSESGKGISIAKIADTVIIREEADIDKLANAFVRKINEASINME